MEKNQQPAEIITPRVDVPIRRATQVSLADSSSLSWSLAGFGSAAEASSLAFCVCVPVSAFLRSLFLPLRTRVAFYRWRRCSHSGASLMEFVELPFLEEFWTRRDSLRDEPCEVRSSSRMLFLKKGGQIVRSH